jgi:tRNA dimethylallyltransferase
VLNADAMQVYRGLDIGTGKLPPEERGGVPHHLLDLADPGETCSAGAFRARTLEVLREVVERGKRPLLVGGTGFYIRALLKDLAPIPAAPHRLREVLNRLLDRRGPAALHGWLAVLDPPAARRTAPGDRQRIERALEVALSSGRPFSSFHGGEMESADRLPALKIGLTLPRALLRERVEARVRGMVERGWPGEVGRLLAAGISPGAHSFKSIGYREMAEAVRGVLSLDDAIGRTVTRTMQFAKRQGTWFRGEKGIHWIDGTDAGIAFAEAFGYIKHHDEGEMI